MTKQKSKSPVPSGKGKRQRKKPSPAKRATFTALLFLLPVLFFIGLEIVLRSVDYGGDQRLFIDAPEGYEKYMQCNQDVGRRYFFMQASVPKPSPDCFLKEKPANGYRIFVMGESTTEGFPFGSNLMFPRILGRMLTDTFPYRHIEVVNTAMTAVNSYTLLDFMDEILAHAPDLILIYTGHNEFYGAFGPASVESLGKMRGVVLTYLELQRFRTFLLVHKGVTAIRKWISGMGREEAPAEAGSTLMERIVVKEPIPLDSPLYERGKTQFERNMTSIFEKARDAGVPVIVSELVSNVRDLDPFWSVGTDSLPPAGEVFGRGRSLEVEGRYAEAREAYNLAKDLDALRFRATEDFNALIHRKAGEFSAPVVPMRRYFEEASPNGLVGDNIMTDHLHPTMDGYFVMAKAFYETMRENGLISKNWEGGEVRSLPEYQREWGATRLDTVYADLRIRYLEAGWPFEPETVVNRTLTDFQPATPEESLAVKILLPGSEMSIVQGHIELAKYFEDRGLAEKALGEYRALMAMRPFEVVAYLQAANILISLKRFDQALELLYESREIQESAFANKWIGLILLADSKVQDAVPFLEKAREMTPSDTQVLYNLGVVYVQLGQRAQAQGVYSRLKQVDPRSQYVSMLERYLQ